jgi:hypothetical protein
MPRFRRKAEKQPIRDLLQPSFTSGQLERIGSVPTLDGGAMKNQPFKRAVATGRANRRWSTPWRWVKRIQADRHGSDLPNDRANRVCQKARGGQG